MEGKRRFLKMKKEEKDITVKEKSTSLKNGEGKIIERTRVSKSGNKKELEPSLASIKMVKETEKKVDKINRRKRKRPQLPRVVGKGRKRVKKRPTVSDSTAMMYRALYPSSKKPNRKLTFKMMCMMFPFMKNRKLLLELKSQSISSLKTLPMPKFERGHLVGLPVPSGGEPLPKPKVPELPLPIPVPVPVPVPKKSSRR